MSKTMPLKARMSEKAYGASELANVYIFDVPKRTSKQSIKKAVEAQYEVSVVSVNVANLSGKPKRIYRRGGRSLTANRTDIKKAYVRLKEGDKLPIFAAVEEAQAKAEAAANKEKK